MSLKPGDVIGDFVVEALLGAGGLSAVWRVRHRSAGSVHALKVLAFQRPDLEKRLLIEARAQSTLRHPFVVMATEVIRVGDCLGLLLEYVDGPNLEQQLARGRPRPDVAEALFRDIVAGVRYAHEAGLVHRDLKPANILLLATGGRWVPKITDFGIALLASDGDPRITQAGLPMGTPQYMAPELILDPRRADARADLFSLGCILYELVCGRRAIEGSNVMEVYDATLQGRYTDPGVLVPDLPARLRQAITGCLMTDRDRRIPDCATLLAVLEGARARGSDPRADVRPPVMALPRTLPDQPTRVVPRAPVARAPVRRDWAVLAWKAGFGVLAAVASLVLVLVIRDLTRRGEPPRATAPDVKPSPKATWSATGDVRTVRIVGAEGSFPVGEAGPGTYEVRADFGSGEIAAGTLRLAPGERVELRCVPAAQLCVKR